MTKTSVEILLPPAHPAIRLGGAFRLLPPAPKTVESVSNSDTTDFGRIRLGGAFRLSA